MLIFPFVFSLFFNHCFMYFFNDFFSLKNICFLQHCYHTTKREYIATPFDAFYPRFLYFIETFPAVHPNMLFCRQRRWGMEE